MEKIRSVYKSNFGRNVIMISGGTAFSQLLTIALSPLITRIYSPNDYGVLTVFAAILGMISLLGALSYDSAIPIADSDEKGINILFLCIIILILFSSLFSIILAFWGEKLLKLFDAEVLVKYKYFISIGFFATGLYTILTNWAFRKKDFKAITKTRLSQSITGNVSKIGLGLLSFGPTGLILGTILGQSAGITTLAKPIYNMDKNVFKSINKKEMISCLKRYKNFPLYSAPTLFLLSFISQVPALFISNSFGSNSAGLYGLAFTITFLPMTFIGKSIQDVFYSEAASIGKSDPKRVKSLSNNLLKKLILIGSAPMLTLAFFGPTIFSLVFGIEWYDAGVYSRLLTFYSFSYLIFHPISVVFSIYEQQKKFFMLNIIKLFVVISVFYVSKTQVLSSGLTILIFSISMVFIELLKYILAQGIMNDEIAKLN